MGVSVWVRGWVVMAVVGWFVVEVVGWLVEWVVRLGGWVGG